MSEHDLSLLVECASKMLSQIGIKLELESILHTNRTDWLSLPIPSTNLNTMIKFRDIFSVTNNTEGLELYIVNEIDRTTAINHKSGIIIGNAVSSRILAHEICHTCGLEDIYPHHQDTTLDVSGPVSRERLPDDWGTNCEGSYYQPGLLQKDLIRRLLMFGFEDNNAALDISTGGIYGIERTRIIDPWTGRMSRRYILSFPKTGIEQIETRSPTHQ